MTTPHKDDRQLDEIVEKLRTDIRTKPLRMHDDCTSYAKAKLQALIAKAVQEAKEQHDHELTSIVTQSLDLIRSVTPARPEDLDLSQWFAIAEALKAAGDELEGGIAALQAKKEGEL